MCGLQIGLRNHFLQVKHDGAQASIHETESLQTSAARIAVLTAPFATRPDDEAGIAVASARSGTPYMDAERRQGQPVNRAETTIELSYLGQLSDRLSLQPSLQYVIHPGTDPALRNATAALLRFEVSL